MQPDGYPRIDASVAHPARIYDYWLGGRDNFAADRAAGDRVIEIRPEIIAGVRANRRFLGRAVRYLVEQQGIRQFLDIGTGLPSADNTHEVAQASAPDARIVYVDNDPIVLAHARALLIGTSPGSTEYVSADLREVDRILASAGETLDLSQPVALMFLMTLQYVPDAEDPHAIVGRYLDALASGSFLVLSDTTIEGQDELLTESARRMNEGMAGRTTQTRRSQADLLRFFDRLSLVEPGLVTLDHWHPGPDESPALDIPAHCALGRKP
ncbi:MAG TPA: SAM-dependent methyltransferase [Trebonia sp.]|nr:SAM-dependent methyltransferase [Trebonia sp.]